MPLPTPILDDRSWQQLRDELVRRIPVYTPEWTDHNASDPGITLLELFAFLGENLLFRFNQVPEATRLEFLRLLQVPMRPARPARAMAALQLAQPTPVLVPEATEVKAGSLSFETQDEARVWPLRFRAVAKLAAPEPAEGDARVYTDAAVKARGLSPTEQAAYYVATVLADDPAVPGFTAVDFSAAVDRVLWVAVLKTKELDPADLSPLSDGLMNLGFVPDPDVASIDQVDPCPGEGASAGGDEVAWEASDPKLVDGAPVYRPLVVEGDTTRGLTRQGVLRLRLPVDVTRLGAPLPPDPDLEGTGDFPPALDDPALAADVVFWIRGYRRRTSARPLPRVLWVGANAAEVLQVRTARAELLATGDGGAGQTASLVHTPLVAGSLRVEVEEPGGWTPWTEVDDFAACGRGDRVYVADPEAGTVRFGDGTRGRAPQIGERIRATTYRYGGGAAGNVAAKTLTKVSLGGVKASNPRPATGGADAEAVADALERIPGELRRHDRAVTAGDFRELALATPGAGVGRAEVMPRFHPASKETDAAGVVSVVVWPSADPVHPDAPTADRDLLRCVCAWLDARRLVTTELYVIPPTYRRVSVSIGLSVKPGFGVEAVRAWVELVVRQYLAPLPPYGPSGQGWPLGRRVYAPELEAAAVQVDGVEYVEKTRLAWWKDAGGGAGAWIEEPVELEPWEVPEVAAVSVVAGTDVPAPGTGIVPPDTGLVPVPIPTLPETC
ncbi:MAG TPA: putative baseplate assembly protein [Longimicrobium sp.]|nr:putative baseplate assembly protein [Longimicrobium sp.]